MMSFGILFLALAGFGCKDKGADTGGVVEGLETEDLGTFTTDSDELTGDIVFNVPSGTRSAMVWCGPYGDSTLGTAWSITDPSGSTIYTNEFHDSYGETKMRVGNHDDVLPIVLPVSPDLDIESGAYTLDAWIASAGKSVSCSAVYRTAAVNSSAIVDIDAVFVGTDSLGLDAASAPDDSDFQAVLDTVDDIWGSAGLKLGSVNYKDFSGDTGTYSVVDMSDTDSSEFNALLRTADPGRPRVVTVFFVEEIANTSGSTVLGLPAGPPGAATVHKTSKSGMVVTSADLRDDTAGLAQIIAHEGAHFLGLFHTSEKDGSTHDPLSDTPECASTDPSDCSGKDQDNLMFWAAGNYADATKLSDDQGWVLRRNPAVD